MESLILTGQEVFTGLDARVLDFWKFSMGNLLTNNTRGYLAEFLVAQAVGSPHGRIEWDDHDVVTSTGVTVEVKAGGYVQAWDRSSAAAPVIAFSGLRGRSWDEASGRRSVNAAYKAQVYVFCVVTARTVEEYQPLDLGQWAFYVLPRESIASTGQSSMRLSTVERLAGQPVPFDQLEHAIEVASSKPEPLD